jgi:hypothetical protein
VCKTLTEEAVLGEIQQSACWRKWLEWDNGGQPLSPDKPVTCKASLVWLGSDGKEIDQAAEVEIDYWPPASANPARKGPRRPDGAREVGKAVRSAAPALADMVGHVVRESLGPIKEVLDLAKKHVEVIDKHLDREAGRVDSAITDMADRAKATGTQAPQTAGGLRGLLDLVSVAKEAKSLLN